MAVVASSKLHGPLECGWSVLQSEGHSVEAESPK